MSDTRVMVTVSGPYGQFTVEASVQPGATFSSIPAPALIELGVEPHRVVRLQANGGGVQFRQLGRALTTVGGQEDVAPVLFEGNAIVSTAFSAARSRLLRSQATSSSSSRRSPPCHTGPTV
jgi:hypothetical protein